MSKGELAMGLMAGLAFVFVAGEWRALVFVLLLALLASSWLPWRYSTTPQQQRRLFAWLGSPVLLISAVRLLGQKQTIETSLGLAVLGTVYVLACGVVEIYRRQARPEVYHMAVMTVMMVSGISSRQTYYPAFLVVYFALAVGLLRRPFGGWWMRPSLPHREVPRAGIILAFLLAMPVAFESRNFAPDLGRWLARTYSQELIKNPLGATHLFGNTSDLRSLQNLACSKALVARVWGSKTWLRGQVYVTYQEGRWTAPVVNERRIEYKPGPDGWITLPGSPPGVSQNWTVAPVKDVLGPVPVPTGVYRIRGFAEMRQDSYDALLGDTLDAYEVTASDSCDERSPSCLEPFDAEYLQLPEGLKQPLLEWSEPILKSASHAPVSLREYLTNKGWYDPGARRPPAPDPILSFIRGGLHGHCELFASTMALTLRARGIPARYVVGLQMAEKNPLGGYFVVRERDAHAWVEAYFNGRWEAYDPTPGTQLAATHPEGQPSWIEGGWDVALSLLATLLSWLRQAHLPGWLLLSITLSPLLGLALRRSSLVAWLRRVRTVGESSDRMLRQLESRLGRHGIFRRSDETVLELAVRLRGELRPEVGDFYADWLRDYADFRFGGRPEGDLENRLGSLPEPSVK